MSAINYRLELPTQWSIHPVFHIDLLTPYRETIMHGPNFTRPTPDIIDGEEEYSVEKILDSRHFGRRRCLQYLVKWEGYPDADNMWVDKDDVFADNKVREFKNSNPDAATHIRGTSSAKSPHLPTTTLSQLLHHHAQAYMSADGNDDLAYEYPAGAIADSPIPLSQEHPVNTCYGQSTVVSDLDVGGFVLNVDGGSRQDLDYVEVRTTEQRDKHTRGDDEKAGTLQSMPTSEREVQGLYKVCTGMGV
jgi:hypothetical protein